MCAIKRGFPYPYVAQVPCPPDDEEDTGAIKRARGPGSAVVGRWTDIPSRSSSSGSLRAGAGTNAAANSGATPTPPRRARDASVVEAAQFMKYFHLVPAAVRAGP